MLLISGGEFLMGTDNPGIPADGEGPQRLVYVDSFHMDIHEVTNKQFQSFVNATGYITEVGRVPVHTLKLNSLQKSKYNHSKTSSPRIVSTY